MILIVILVFLGVFGVVVLSLPRVDPVRRSRPARS